VVAGKRGDGRAAGGQEHAHRLELTPAGSPIQERYHKITYSAEALDTLLVEIFLEAHGEPLRKSCWI